MVKPTEYLHGATSPVGLRVFRWKSTWEQFCFISFPFAEIAVVHGILRDNNTFHDQGTLVRNQLPKVGEWTRIEIGHEKVGNKYFLSLSVGGMFFELRKLTDASGNIGDVLHWREHCQHGFIRRLVILGRSERIFSSECLHLVCALARNDQLL